MSTNNKIDIQIEYMDDEKLIVKPLAVAKNPPVSRKKVAKAPVVKKVVVKKPGAKRSDLKKLEAGKLAEGKKVMS